MSVINKMLQDLQQRNANSAEQATVLNAQSLQVQPATRSFKSFWLLLILLLLALLWWFGTAQKQTTAASPEFVAQPEHVSAVRNETISAEKKPELITEVSAEISSEISPEVSTEKNSALIAAISPNTNTDKSAALGVDAKQPTTETLALVVSNKNQASRLEVIVDEKPTSSSLTETPLAKAQKPVDASSFTAEPSPAAREVNLTAEPSVASSEPSLSIEQAPVSALQQEFDLAVKAAAAQQWQQALAYLTAEQPVATFPAYFALKAAVLQQQAEWSAALELYQQLLQLEPHHAGWNLAAGISAQQLSTNALAQRFYSVAWQHRTQLPAASQAYLQQQLSLMKP